MLSAAIAALLVQIGLFPTHVPGLARHVRQLQLQLKFLRSSRDAGRLAALQVSVCVLLLIGALLMSSVTCIALTALFVALPKAWLARRCQQRVTKLEAQI